MFNREKRDRLINYKFHETNKNYILEAKVLETIIIKTIVTNNDKVLLGTLSSSFFIVYRDLITILKKIVGSVEYADILSYETVDSEYKNIIYMIKNTHQDNISVNKAINRLKEISFILNIKNNLEEIISNLNSRNITENYLRIAHLTKNLCIDYEQDGVKNSISPKEFLNIVSNRKVTVTRRMPTGIKTVDYKLFGGLAYGEIIILAAQPGGGKTGFCIHLFSHNLELLRKEKKICLFFSLDMNPMAIYYRLICRKFGIGYNEAQEICNRTDVKEYIESLPILVFNRHTIDSVIDAINNSPKQIGLLVFDYIQLIVSDGDSLNDKITTFISSIKQHISLLDCPIILISQLNRNYSKRNSDVGHHLSDLKDSSVIEQSADLVLFLSNTEIEKNIIISILKNRNGPCGQIIVEFRKSEYFFTDVENQNN